MPSYVPPKRNEGLTLFVSLPSATVTSEYQTNPTLGVGDARVSIDGGALNNLTALPTVFPAGSSVIRIQLTAAEMDGDTIVIQMSDQTNPKEWADVNIIIQTAAYSIDDIGDIVDSIDTSTVAGQVWSSGTRTLTALDEDDTSIDLDSNIRAAVGLSSANLETQLGTIEAKVDQIDGSWPSVQEIVDGVWDEDVTNHTGIDSTGQALQDAGGSGAPPTVQEIADEVQARTLSTNIVQVAGVNVGGQGSETDPWGPA